MTRNSSASTDGNSHASLEELLLRVRGWPQQNVSTHQQSVKVIGSESNTDRALDQMRHELLERNDTIESLRKTVASKQVQIASQHQGILKGQHEAAGLRRDNESLQQALSSLKNDNETLRRELAGQKDNNGKLQRELASLQSKLSNAATVVGSESGAGVARQVNPVINSDYSFPVWYTSSSGRGKSGARPDNAMAKSLVNMRKSAKNLKNLAGEQLAADINDLRDSIQHLFFKDINKATVIAGQALEGLKWISESPVVPWYVRSDAMELLRRWSAQNFSGDIMKGILIGKSQDPDRPLGLSLEQGFIKSRRYAEWGNNGLQNGQWWPYQLCTLRDGAHGSSQGGIAGNHGRGAYSIVISSHSEYVDGLNGDLDRGEEIWYMGTAQDLDRSSSGPTAATQYMIDACSNNKDIRVIRSHRDSNTANPSVYAPETGYRYDGLYKVVDFVMSVPATHHYRFHLIRNPGQEPIRYKGPEKRPNKREIAAARGFASQLAGMKRRRVEA